ncbi:MAG: hypothetical protein ACYTGS_09300, partial [Planctomycetota bacterium]
SAGEQILDDTDDKDGQAGIVLQQANVARLQISEAVTKAQKALMRNDLEGAIDIVLRTGATGNQNERIVELVAKLKSLGAIRIKENLDNGRINLAYSLWQKISPLANGCTEMSELGLALDRCRQAAGYVTAGKPRAAVPLLRQVKLTCPAAKWLSTATDQTRQAAELLDELAASPLGLDIAGDTLPNMDGTDNTQNGIPSMSEGLPCINQDNAASNNRTDSSLPSRLVLQMDGIGSFIVLRDRRVTVGPVSSSQRPMIGLMADPNLPVARIERAEDDYFIRSSNPIGVNDTTTTQKLLVDGDRISLSPRCGMKFNIPNPASTTATLTLSSARLGRADVRRVILMDRDILVGPGIGNHIIADFLDETVALFVQNGRLLCKTKDRILVEDKPVSPRAGLPIDKQIRIGQISLVLTELKE